MTVYAFSSPSNDVLIIADGVYAAPVYAHGLSAAKSAFIDEVYRFSNYTRKALPKNIERSFDTVKISLPFDVENLSDKPFLNYVKIDLKPAREFAVQTAFTFKCLCDGKNADYSTVLNRLKSFASNIGVAISEGGFMETVFGILDSEEVLCGQNGGLDCMLIAFILNGEAKKIKAESLKCTPKVRHFWRCIFYGKKKEI